MSSREGSITASAPLIQRSVSALASVSEIGVVRLDHGVQVDLLHLGAELRLHLIGVVLERPRGHVEDLRLAQVVNGPERPDGGGKLGVVAREEALHLGARPAASGEPPKEAPLMARVRDGKDRRRLAGTEDLAEDAADAHAHVDRQNAVDVLELVLDLFDLRRRGDNCIHGEIHVGQLAAQLGELLAVGGDLLVEVQQRRRPMSPLDAHEDPGDLDLAPAAARADQLRACGSCTRGQQAGARQAHGTPSGQLKEFPAIDLSRHGLLPFNNGQ